MLTDEGQNDWNVFAKQDTYSSADELYPIGIRQIIVKVSRGTWLSITSISRKHVKTCTASTTNITTAPLLHHPFMQIFNNISACFICFLYVSRKLKNGTARNKEQSLGSLLFLCISCCKLYFHTDPNTRFSGEVIFSK